MSWWNKVKRALRGEADEAKEIARELETKMSADLDRRERELRATPEERLDAAAEGAARADAAFDEVARTIRDRDDDTR